MKCDNTLILYAQPFDSFKIISEKKKSDKKESSKEKPSKNQKESNKESQKETLTDLPNFHTPRSSRKSPRGSVDFSTPPQQDQGSAGKIRCLYEV